MITFYVGQTDYINQLNNLVALVTAIGGGTSILAKLAGANLNSTSDQPIIGLPTKYMITDVVITNCSGSASVAAGGIYTGVAKSGSQVVYSGQKYASLTTPASLLKAAFAVGALETAYTAATLYLSLTTAQGAAMTSDIYIIGIALT